MSRSLGPALPEALLARLLLRPEAVADRAVILVTVDPYGLPHPALVSYAELYALDAGRIRLGLHGTTRTARHLADAGRGTLIFADAEFTHYVKADATALPPAPGEPGLARFELHLRDVLEDRAEGEEEGARLIGGITFAVADPAAWAARGVRLRRALVH